MKTILVLGLCVIMAVGVPLNIKDEDKLRLAPAVEQQDDRTEDGEYTIHYTTAEGTEIYEKGWFVPNANGTDKVLVYEGSYSYIGKDGIRYTTKYHSDISGGFQAEGAHLPKQSEPESLAA